MSDPADSALQESQEAVRPPPLFDASLDAAILSPPTPPTPPVPEPKEAPLEVTTPAFALTSPTASPQRRYSYTRRPSIAAVVPAHTLHLITPLQLHPEAALMYDAGAAQLAASIAANPAVTSLCASLHHVGLHGAASLEAALRTPGLQLRVADLRFRELAWTAAERLCQSVLHLPLLQSLTLRCCSLGDEGTRWLCAALVSASQLHPSSLTHLDLAENGIGDEGAQALATLIETHVGLKAVSLEENCVTAEGAYALGKAVQTHRQRRTSSHGYDRTHRSDDSGAPLLQVSLPAYFEGADSGGGNGTAVALGHAPPSYSVTPDSIQWARRRSLASDGRHSPQAFPTPDAWSPLIGAVGAAPADWNAPSPARRRSSDVSLSAHATAATAGGSGHATQAGSPVQGNLTIGDSEASLGWDHGQGREQAISDGHAAAAVASPPPARALVTLNLRYNKMDLLSPLPCDPPPPPSATPRGISNAASAAAIASATSFAAAMAQPHTILARFLSVGPSTHGLRTLDLSLNALGDATACVLARSLAHNASVTRLGLSYCSIGEVGGVSLARALSFNDSVTRLDLSLNSLGVASMAALADSLGGVNQSLTHLNLSSNLLTDACCWALADALAMGGPLTELNLDANCIGDQGAHALAQALFRSPALRKLHVDNNNMGSEAEELLALAQVAQGRGHGTPVLTPEEIAARRARMRQKISQQMSHEQRREAELNRRHVMEVAPSRKTSVGSYRERTSK